MTQLRRREMIAGLLGWPLAAIAGCSPHKLPPAGELLGTNFAAGHRIRDGRRPQAEPEGVEAHPIVIVGGGIAGLTAAWRLLRAGLGDFVLLELESRPGGTARSGTTGPYSYPWGAHYVPVPMAEHQALISLLSEMNVVESLAPDGTPVVAEQFLCRDPQERLFHHGRWHEGIYLADGASADDLRQLDEFRSEIDRWVAGRDSVGRRHFAIPLSHGSDEPAVQALDRLSMAQWMDRHGFSSPRLRWLVDYACRDDYGLSMDRVSAWAGLFYFTSRITTAGREPQSVITWPAGNGRFVQHLSNEIGDRIRCSQAVYDIHPSSEHGLEGEVAILTTNTANQRSSELRAQQVIFAAPQMLARHVIRGFPALTSRNLAAFKYGSWLVANIHLSDRPAQAGFPMCWDNVFYESRSLGYISSTHQSGSDFGPTVLTWYHPFAEDDPQVIRQRMLELQWSDWANLVLADLRSGHPDIDALVERLDIMLWGHAMIQPYVGFVWSPARREAAQPVESIHFAGTDLSGVPLFEEAFYHGVRAAEEVLERRGHPFESIHSARRA